MSTRKSGDNCVAGPSRQARNSRSIPQTRIRHRGRKPSDYITRREVKGGKIDVHSNPPEIAYQPWLQLTVVHSGISGDFTIRVRDLCYQIKEQIDPTGHGLLLINRKDKWSDQECIMQIRLRSVRAWNLTGRIISLSVDDFSDANKSISDVDTLCGIVDTGSTSHVPAVGYQLPLSHQNIVLRNDNNTNQAILYHVMSPTTDNCIIYTNVFFRFDGPAKVSGFQDTMIRLVRSIKTDLSAVREISGQIRKDVSNIESHSETTIGNAIVRGAEIVAPYVIPAAAVVDEALHHKMDELCALMRLSNYDDVSIISGSEALPPTDPDILSDERPRKKDN